MYVFIDTNVLLDFYRMSQGDLEELRKLSKLIEHKRIVLLISSITRDEFYRNREGVIQTALSEFKKSEIKLQRPNIIRPHKESVELERIHAQFKAIVETLATRIVEEAASSKMKADQVIEELFGAAAKQDSAHDVSEMIVNSGIRRGTLGRPPGKRDSCGDAIHWEWLLATVPPLEDLHLISRDGDFASPLNSSSLNDYLAREWEAKNKTKCRLYISLSDFLTEHFPDIKLTDEVEKSIAISRLEQSPNFRTTHNAIEELQKFDDFSVEELTRLVTAIRTNNQIRWITGDADFAEFGEKLRTLAESNGLNELADTLDDLLEDTEESSGSSSEAGANLVVGAATCQATGQYTPASMTGVANLKVGPVTMNAPD